MGWRTGGRLGSWSQALGDLVRALSRGIPSHFVQLLEKYGQAIDFEITGYPTTFYLDPGGLIQYKREGFEEDGYEHQTAIRIDALRGAGT